VCDAFGVFGAIVQRKARMGNANLCLGGGPEKLQAHRKEVTGAQRATRWCHLCAPPARPPVRARALPACHPCGLAGVWVETSAALTCVRARRVRRVLAGIEVCFVLVF
jgi:hypothetical protein